MAKTKKKTKDRILEHAAELFAVKGYLNTSIQEISDAAEANIAAVNYHFRSKELLFQEVARYCFTLTQTKHGVANEIETDHETWLRQHIAARMNALLDSSPTGFFPKIVQQHCGLEQHMADQLFKLLDPVKQHVHDCIEQLLGPKAQLKHIRCIALNIHAPYVMLNFGPDTRIHLFGTEHPDREQIEEVILFQQEYVIGGIRALRTKIEEEAL